MIHWPSSVPDYRWPDRLLARRHAPRRWMLAAAFHAAYAIGAAFAAFRPHRDDVLVLRTDGIGDAILFEPALRSLASAFPGARLHYWAPAAAGELFASHPAIWEHRAVPRGAKPGNLQYFESLRWRWVMGWRLGSYRFKLCVYAAQSPEPMGNWIFRCARARERWYVPGDTENQFGWQRERTSNAATRLLRSPSGSTHELSSNAFFASQWGGDAHGRPTIAIPSLARQRAEAEASGWRRAAIARGLGEVIGIMPGSATAVNAYPSDSWARVIRALWQTRRAMCVLFGGADDASRLADIERLAGDACPLRIGPGTPLLSTAAMLQQLDGFITMDTGLAHLALSLEVPTVVIANGGHPGRFFPWPAPTRSIVLTHRMPCEGCLCRCVLKEPECVTRVEPDQVLAACTAIMPSADRAVA
jgi:heptosyltransferase II